MNRYPANPLAVRRCILPIVGLMFAILASPLRGEEVAAPDPVLLWQEIAAASASPVLPAEWEKMEPGATEAWWKTETTRLAKLARQAEEFCNNFPGENHLLEARRKQRDALSSLARFGDPHAKQSLDELERTLASDPRFPAKERYNLRVVQVCRTANGNSAELEKGARELLKEFPGEPKLSVEP